MIQILASFGYMSAAKAVMEMLGVSVGPPRLPNSSLSSDQKSDLRSKLETLQFFDWIKR